MVVSIGNHNTRVELRCLPSQAHLPALRGAAYWFDPLDIAVAADKRTEPKVVSVAAEVVEAVGVVRMPGQAPRHRVVNELRQGFGADQTRGSKDPAGWRAEVPVATEIVLALQALCRHPECKQVF